MNQILIEITCHTDIDRAFKQLDFAATKALNNHKKLFIKYGTDTKMTNAQRGSLHVWCKEVADTLNNFGLYHEYTSPVREVTMEVEWTMGMIKDMLYKPVLKALTGKASTEQQSTIEPSQVADTIIKNFAMKGVVLPEWPSNQRPRK